MQRDYISPKGLENLKFYEYHASDKSLIANYILQPFWRTAVEWLPRNLAPNLITLLGFAGILFSYLTVAFFCPQFVGVAPAYSYLFCAIGMFYYQTMDALDGKQARRTGTSSPLGELFDHGCDALTTVLMGLNLACAVQMETDLPTLLVLFGGFGVFFMAQWEEYHTGIMELGHLSVTEIHYIAITMYLLSYFNGPDWWFSPLFEGFKYNAIPIYVLGLGTAVTMLKNAVTVFGTKKHSLATKLTQIVSITHLLVAGVAWALTSPNGIYQSTPHLFVVTYGFVFSYLAGRIVVARVCREDFSAIHKNSLILTVPAIVSVLVHQKIIDLPAFAAFEVEILYACFAVAVLSYFHFALNVIRQMCKHLDIACLTIKPKKITKDN